MATEVVDECAAQTGLRLSLRCGIERQLVPSALPGGVTCNHSLPEPLKGAQLHVTDA